MRACPDCRGPLTSTVSEHAYRFDRGKPIQLRAVTKRSCATCKYYDVVIPRVGPLHRAISQALGVLNVGRDAITFVFEKGPKGVEDGCWSVMLRTT